MKAEFTRIAAFAAGLAGMSIMASATTVDFTGAGVTNYQVVSQLYGDNAQVDLQYRSLNGGNNWGQLATQFSANVEYWANANYSGDQAIFATANGKKLEMTMVAATGLNFTSVTFDLGAYPNSNLNTAFRIFDANWNELLSNASQLVTGAIGGGALITLSLLNTSALHFQMGDNWNVGLNAVTYNVSSVSAVPLPGALLFLGTGLVGLAGMRSRRKKLT